ncbi:MAG: phosphotransferase family protein [bacterium]
MLETTLKTNFIPGTNLSGGLASGDWRFLLPSLKFERLLCLGAPDAASVPVLVTLGQSVLVLSDNQASLQQLLQQSRDLKAANFQVLLVDSLKRPPLSNGHFDLIYLSAQDPNSIFQEGSVLPDLLRLLRSDGVFYCETNGFADFRSVNKKMENGFKATHTFWLTPFSGKMRTALPTRDRKIAHYFFSNVLFGQSFKKRALSQTGKILSRSGLLSSVTPRRALVIRNGEQNGAASEPPKYVQDLADKAGFDFSDYRFGLSTRGLGNSNKAIFYLFGKSEKKPSAVIKMTRAPEFNYRLENEYHMLSLVDENAFVEAGTFPEPLFLSYHNDLAVLCMRAVEGDPFRKRTQADENCPLAQDALKWIVALGESSASPNEASPKEVSAALLTLFDRFNDIYRLTENQRTFLENKIAGIAASAAFPLVLQHGDPGTWNILVSKENKVIIIDWEAGEPKGMPLWDLFYFFRTYASWASRMRGSRDSLKNFTEHFLKPSPLSFLLLEVLERYCEKVALEKEMIEPLFYTCWMHRALKEATRLTPESLDAGHYVNLLKCAIDQRDSSNTLQKLFLLK